MPLRTERMPRKGAALVKKVPATALFGVAVAEKTSTEQLFRPMMAKKAPAKTLFGPVMAEKTSMATPKGAEASHRGYNRIWKAGANVANLAPPPGMANAWRRTT